MQAYSDKCCSIQWELLSSKWPSGCHWKELYKCKNVTRNTWLQKCMIPGDTFIGTLKSQRRLLRSLHQEHYRSGGGTEGRGALKYVARCAGHVSLFKASSKMAPAESTLPTKPTVSDGDSAELKTTFCLWDFSLLIKIWLTLVFGLHFLMKTVCLVLW